MTDPGAEFSHGIDLAIKALLSCQPSTQSQAIVAALTQVRILGDDYFKGGHKAEANGMMGQMS